MAKTLEEYHYPFQIHYNFPKAIYHLQDLEKKFCNPDEGMKALITQYGVEQMFFENESTLLICASKGNELKPEVLEKAVLEPEQYERWLNFQLIKSFEDSISIVCSDDRPGEIGIKCNLEIRHKIFQRLLEPSKGMKELMQDKLSKQLLKLCKDIFFREIWHTEPEDTSLPKSLEQPEDAEEKREFDLFMNFLMVKSFENSIKYVPRNPETPHIVDITCDPNLRSLLYRRLQDPSTGLKEYIEKAFKDNQRLLIYQNLFFWKIWHSEPFDSTKPVSITAVVSNGNILPANDPQ